MTTFIHLLLLIYVIHSFCFVCFIISICFSSLFFFGKNLFHSKSYFDAAYSDKSACSIASGGSSSIGGNSTATLGNDYPSLTTSDDFPDDIEFSTNYGKKNVHTIFLKFKEKLTTYSATRISTENKT